MAEFDRMEDRLRRTFRWVATNSGDDRGARGVPDGPGGRDRSGGDPDSGLYLDDPPPARQGRRIGRTTVLIGVAAVLVAAAGVPLGLVAASTGGGGGSGTHGEARTHHSKGPTDAAAKTQVVSALGATTNAGNWDISYKYSEVLGSNESAVPSTGVVCSAGSPCAPVATPAYHQPVTVTGSGVIDVNPKAMVTTADVSDFGRVVVRLNSTTVWEDASGDSGALALDAPNSASGGQSLSGYAGLVEGTLGTREGAVAMLGLGSPNGYLELVQNAIVGVSSTGTGTVDGKAVSQYHVSVQPAQLADDPSASPEEVTTIQNAVSTLQTQGLSGTTADVSVDTQGFIVRSVTTYQFSDGGSVTVQGDFSNFGCAGTVLMPGQTGPTAPPAGCVSPDSQQSSTTTTAPPSTTTTTVPPSTTTSAPNSSTSTTLPASTTTTRPSSSTTSTVPATTTTGVAPPTTMISGAASP